MHQCPEEAGFFSFCSHDCPELLHEGTVCLEKVKGALCSLAGPTGKLSLIPRASTSGTVPTSSGHLYNQRMAQGPLVVMVLLTLLRWPGFPVVTGEFSHQPLLRAPRVRLGALSF